MRFNYKKATQILRMFAAEHGGRITKLMVLKLVFFADRYHLRKYGRTITGDRYVAMQYGPVASGVKDVAELSSFLDPVEREYADNFLKMDPPHGIVAIGTPDLSVLSESDIEAVNAVVKALRGCDLVKVSHLFPEWKRHSVDGVIGAGSRIDMDILDFFDDAGKDAARFELVPMGAEERSAMRAAVEERMKCESFIFGGR